MKRHPNRKYSPNVRGLLLPAVLVMFATASVITSPKVAAQGGQDPQVTRAGDLEMAVKAGFGGLSIRDSTGSWVPFRIALRNQGPPISGRVLVHIGTDTSSTQGIDFVREVNLPTGSSQLHEIPVFLRSSQRQPTIRLTNRHGSDETVVAETQVTVERQRSFMNERLEIAVVDSDSTALNDINSAEIERSPRRAPFKKDPAPKEEDVAEEAALAAAQSRGRRRRGPFFGQFRVTAQPVVISPEELPRDFVSYDAVGAVVIGDAPVSQLAPEQARALRLWVASGGLLIVTGGADFAGLRAVGLGDLVPVDAEGLISLESPAELTEVYGRFETSDIPLVMSGRLQSDARVLIGGSNLPLAAEKEFGKGLVRYVAINPKLNPYRGWAAAKELWSDLLLPAAEAERQRRNALMAGWGGRGNQGIEGFLFKLAAIKPPSANYFLLFLLVYILMVGPLNYLALRWTRKLDLAWVTIPAVVIVFTAVSVAVAQITRGSDSVASDVAIVEVYQPQRISTSLGGLLIMPSSKGTHEIAFNGPDTYVADFDRSASDPMEIERSTGGPLLRVQMNKWTSRSFQTNSIAEDAAPLVGVDFAGVNSVRVKNLTDLAIKQAVVVANGVASELFNLGPGEVCQVSLSALPAQSFADWYAGLLTQGTEEQELFGDLSPALESGRAQRGNFFAAPSMASAGKLLSRPLLIGFTDSTTLAFDFRESQRRRSRALYVVYL